MRMEQLFQQIDHFMRGNSVWDNRAAISSLIDILTIFSRNDLKSEILKELERHVCVLSSLAEKERVDVTKLQKILSELKTISQQLYSTSGKIGLTLMDSDLFKSISQRSAIPGGTCAFDLPAYHHWLQQSDEQRREDLELWLKPFKDIRRAIDLVLHFIRNSSLPTHECAPSGFYQQTLDRSMPFQLIRVGIQNSLPYFAEISGGKHRFSIRFMAIESNSRPAQSKENIEFDLTRCIF